MFGDFEDDIFDEKPVAESHQQSVNLLQKEKEWFFSETWFDFDSNEKWLRLKLAADRYYRKKQFEAAAHAYMSCVDTCSSNNLGLLRDCVDGAARACHNAGPGFYELSKKHLDRLASMATCEDHRFSYASTAFQMTGSIGNLQTLVDAEAQSGFLWKTLGEAYLAKRENLFAVACFLKAANVYRNSARESKDRFKQQNLILSKDLNAQCETLVSGFFENSSGLLEKLDAFFESRAGLKREASVSFEKFWFPDTVAAL